MSMYWCHSQIPSWKNANIMKIHLKSLKLKWNFIYCILRMNILILFSTPIIGCNNYWLRLFGINEKSKRLFLRNLFIHIIGINMFQTLLFSKSIIGFISSSWLNEIIWINKKKKKRRAENVFRNIRNKRRFYFKSWIVHLIQYVSIVIRIRLLHSVIWLICLDTLQVLRCCCCGYPTDLLLCMKNEKYFCFCFCFFNVSHTLSVIQINRDRYQIADPGEGFFFTLFYAGKKMFHRWW